MQIYRGLGGGFRKQKEALENWNNQRFLDMILVFPASATQCVFFMYVCRQGL
jgi:hypothetical protein